jgi:diadenosine tetraphosphate (Ap4A) HIT family hydrolase
VTSIPRAPAPPPPNEAGCIFCRILRGEAPAEFVARSDRAVAFLTIEPLAEGHTLVLPIAHAPDLTAVSTQDTEAVWRLVHTVERRLRLAGFAEGVDVICFSGAPAEQGVLHLHVHVIPRRAGDALNVNRWWKDRQRSTTPARQAEVARRIRAAAP